MKSTGQAVRRALVCTSARRHCGAARALGRWLQQSPHMDEAVAAKAALPHRIFPSPVRIVQPTAACTCRCDRALRRRHAGALQHCWMRALLSRRLIKDGNSKRIFEGLQGIGQTRRSCSSPARTSQTCLYPPKLKVRTPAHTKQLGWYVDFESRVTHLRYRWRGPSQSCRTSPVP